eukprot:SAG11_NODE_860_length_6850_cov_4.138350_3_plen_390_part_00
MVRRALMLRAALLASRLGDTVYGYGEGLYSTAGHPSLLQPRHYPGWNPHTLEFTQQLHCATLAAEEPLRARLRGRLPGEAIGARRCIELSVRADDSRNWWHLVPPAPSHDASFTRCGNTSRGDDGTPTLEIELELPVREGYALLSAALLDEGGAAPLAHAAMRLASPRERATADGDEVGRLAEAHRVVRADEAEDRAERHATIAANAARYEELGLRRHPRLTLREGGSLSELLDPALVSALERGDLWSVLRGSDHTTRCRGTVPVDANGAALPSPTPGQTLACSSDVYTLPVFRPDAAADLVSEILHAKTSLVGPDLSLPNNGQEERTERTGVILDEIGLGDLARALAVDVLAPVARELPLAPSLLLPSSCSSCCAWRQLTSGGSSGQG